MCCCRPFLHLTLSVCFFSLISCQWPSACYINMHLDGCNQTAQMFAASTEPPSSKCGQMRLITTAAFVAAGAGLIKTQRARVNHMSAEQRRADQNCAVGIPMGSKTQRFQCFYWCFLAAFINYWWKHGSKRVFFVSDYLVTGKVSSSYLL